MNLTKVDEMHDGMEDAVEEDEATGELMEVDVHIQRKDVSQTELPDLCDAMPEHRHQNKHAREIQALT